RRPGEREGRLAAQAAGRRIEQHRAAHARGGAGQGAGGPIGTAQLQELSELHVLVLHRVVPQQRVHQLLEGREHAPHEEHGGDQVAHRRRPLVAGVGQPHPHRQGEHAAQLGRGAGDHLQAAHLLAQHPGAAGA
ncbi:MAG: hypothetical protein ACK56F_22250, partial [bacterium]